MQTDTVKSTLKSRFPESALIVYPAKNGYLISITDHHFDADNLEHNQQQVLDSLKKGGNGIDEFVFIHRLFTYQSEDEAFVVPATLRTVPSRRETGGSTSTLAAGDAFLLLREVDAELLAMGDEPGQPILAREELNDDGTPILEFKPNHFRELDIHGAYTFPVKKAMRQGDHIVIEIEW